MEAALTGESLPVAKSVTPLAPETLLADRANLAYGGTVVVAGSGLGLVVATGLETETGRISRLLAEAVSLDTPLTRRMMPVANLPAASWQTAFGLGFVSAVFDNIPLTALALKQGGYDWGFLAFAVGFGGSMVWFGSSAGVALCNLFPEGRSVGRWLRYGWPVAVAYVVGFATLLLVLGWHPDAPHKAAPTAVALRN